MDYNYHTHTYRCGHALGTDEDYILTAINSGIRYLGFSDHIPLLFEDGSENVGVRVPVSEGASYVSDLQLLRDKFKNQIEISIGFESEYYPSCFASMVEDARRWGAEYLILGQHYTKPERPASVPHAFVATDDVSYLQEHAASTVAAIQTGIFTYIAHPDVLNFTGDPEIYRQAIRQICQASRTYNVPLELNFLGIRGHRHYPNPLFWEIAGQEQSPVTFGLDAHRPQDVCPGQFLPIAKAFAEEHHLNYIGKPKLVRI